VEIDPRESDLRIVESPGVKVDVATGTLSAGGSTFGAGAAGTETELWPWIALVALMFALLEHIIANVGRTMDPHLSAGLLGAIRKTKKVETS
jgi:hypothetical protein